MLIWHLIDASVNKLSTLNDEQNILFYQCIESIIFLYVFSVERRKQTITKSEKKKTKNIYNITSKRAIYQMVSNPKECN